MTDLKKKIYCKMISFLNFMRLTEYSKNTKWSIQGKNIETQGTEYMEIMKFLQQSLNKHATIIYF